LNDPVVVRHVRRRRTWYRRRLRIQKTLVAASVFLLLLAATWQNVARLLDLPRLHSSQLFSDPFWARGNIHRNLASLAAKTTWARAWRLPRTYPFSVIPGGVRNANQLREIAARDYVVRQHYARFNYQRAELIRAREARLVYMSYRRQNAIYWTSKKIRLPAGELLLSDGVITARARCGNQISETPKAEVAAEEPEEDVLDQPVAEVSSSHVLPFRSSLARPSLPFVNPIPPPQLFATNVNFPYATFGSWSGRKPTKFCDKPENQNNEICRHHHRHPPAPEPSTLLLISSGLAIVFWRYRRTARA